MTYRTTLVADGDIVAILKETRSRFGVEQVGLYSGLIDRTISLLLDDPLRPSSKDRFDFGADVRSIHMHIAAGRSNAASHVVYYQHAIELNGERSLTILRVLHHAMEPRTRLATALRELKLR